MVGVANVNGVLSKLEDAQISVMDRGFLYGDSLYEVIFLRNGIPIFWEDHFTRMNQSADSMGMKITQTDNEIREKMIETIKYLGKVEGEVYVRWIVTRGAGPIDMLLQKEPTNYVIIAKPFAHEHEHKAIRCVVTEIQRNHMGATDPRIKSGNYLNNVLALAEATKAGFDEPIMLTIDGKLAECSRSNIWLVIDDVIVTPKDGCLAGITRKNLLKSVLQSNSGLKVVERDIYYEEIIKASEAFHSSSSRDVWPIKQIQLKKAENNLIIDFPEMGDVSKKLGNVFKKYVAEYCEEKGPNFFKS